MDSMSIPRKHEGWQKIKPHRPQQDGTVNYKAAMAYAFMLSFLRAYSALVYVLLSKTQCLKQ